MVEGNYEKILEKIARASGLDREEIDRRIEAKRAKLAGLISREGAAQIIAAELGLSFDKEKLKINELLPGMRKVNVIGQILSLSPVRGFTTKKGDEGKVVNLIIADETSNIKVVLWDTNHIALIEKGEIGEGHVVEIGNGSMRANELHLGSFSELKKSKEILEKIMKDKVVKEKNISDFTLPDSVSTRAFIVQAFEPKFFYVCSECKKKVGEDFVCGEHGKISPEKRAVMNLVIDDGTESIRSVLFHEQLSKIGMTDLDNSEQLLKQKQELLGKEMVFSGEVRINKFFNNQEFIIDNIQEINSDELIAELEKE